MTKAEAFDFITDVIINGVNCWESSNEDLMKNLAYITGIVDALVDATKEEKA